MRGKETQSLSKITPSFTAQLLGGARLPLARPSRRPEPNWERPPGTLRPEGSSPSVAWRETAEWHSLNTTRAAWFCMRGGNARCLHTSSTYLVERGDRPSLQGKKVPE